MRNFIGGGVAMEGLEGRAMLTAVVGLLAGNEVVVFDSAAPEQVLARRTIAMPRGETLVGIDFSARERTLEGISAAHQFYAIDLETGVATLDGTGTPVPAASGDALAFELPPLQLEPGFVAVSRSGSLFGGFISFPNQLAQVGYVAGDVNAGERPDLVNLAYRQEPGEGLGSQTAFAIDARADALVTIGTEGGAKRSPATGRLYTVGALGADADGNTGIDIAALDDGRTVAYASFRRRDGSTVFSTVDLATGMTSPVGTVGGRGGPGLRDIAVFPMSADTALGVTAGNQVLAFDPVFPSAILGRTAVTGLRADEAILSMDERPGTGELFAVSSRDAVYRVDLETGVATAVGPRFTAFFKGLPAAADFDPVSGYLQVVSDRGEVLRLDADTGDVVDARPFVRGVQIDAPLHYAAPDATVADVMTVAHSNNFVGTAGSTLYGFDRTTQSLVAASGSGSGVLSSVAGLSLGVTDIASLDILSTAEGDVAFLAVRTNDRPVRVFRVDLETGARTGGNGIASGSKPVRDIAIVTR